MSLRQESTSFLPEYKGIVDATNKQIGLFHWTAEEIEVEKDIHDVLVNFTEAERHGVFTTLKLFTLYEVKAGSDYWTGRFMKEFKQHECQSMAAAFGMMELCVHKVFYNKINELLNVSNEQFYTDYVNDPTLKARMDCINSIIDNPDPYISLAAFSLVEGVILYSNFAFLKHFQSNGKNKMLNIVRGINYSTRDENLHSQAGALVFNTLVETENPDNLEHIHSEVRLLSKEMVEHEDIIIDKIFQNGEVEGITASELKLFVRNRVNVCLKHLGIDSYYKHEEESSINKWFYTGVDSYQFNDIFTGKGREYSRQWNEEEFVW